MIAIRRFPVKPHWEWTHWEWTLGNRESTGRNLLGFSENRRDRREARRPTDCISERLATKGNRLFLTGCPFSVKEVSQIPGSNGCYWSGSTLPQHPAVQGSSWSMGFVNGTPAANQYGYDTIGWNATDLNSIATTGAKNGVKSGCITYIYQTTEICCPASSSYLVYKTY
jgi:hypothetical protein